jgi:hypothetical protein
LKIEKGDHAGCGFFNFQFSIFNCFIAEERRRDKCSATSSTSRQLNICFAVSPPFRATQTPVTTWLSSLIE